MKLSEYEAPAVYDRRSARPDATRFLDEVVDAAPGRAVAGSALYTAYVEWATRTGLPVMSSSLFGFVVKGFGIVAKKTLRGMDYLGIALKES